MYITTTSLHISAITPRLCVMNMIAIPMSFCRFRIRSRICASVVTSSAVVGSSAISKLGVHDTLEGWKDAGEPDLLEECRQKARDLMKSHRPLPLDEDVERELARIRKRTEAAV